MLVDCHAHVYTPQFSAQDVDAVLHRAQHEAHLDGVVVVGESLSDAETILNLSLKHPRFVFPAAGLHSIAPLHPTTEPITPHMRMTALQQELPLMLEFIRVHHRSLICIGEIGLDYAPHFLGTDTVVKDAFKHVQQQVFEAQIDLGMELGLPLNIHSRNAGHYVIETLVRKNVTVPVLLHAFDGKPAYALRAVRDLPHTYFSVPPCVVRSPQMQKLVSVVPLDRLVVETDSPVLGPQPKEVNEPKNVTISIREIARIKQMHEKEVSRQVGESTVKLFPKLKEKYLPE